MKPSRWISASGWRPLHTAAAWVPVLAGSRELTLWMTVVFMWAIVACYIVVLEQHARVNGRPQENNMNTTQHHLPRTTCHVPFTA